MIDSEAWDQYRCRGFPHIKNTADGTVRTAILLPFLNFSGLACVVAFLPEAAGAFAFDEEEVDVDEDVVDDDSCLGMIISSAVRRAYTGVSGFYG